MKDELIKYDTAVLAKKKGFDWLVYAYYQNDKEEVDEFISVKLNSHFYCDKPKFDLLHNANSNTIWYSRPTQSLLQKWLREKHNIDIDIKSNPTFSKQKVYSVHIKKNMEYVMDAEFTDIIWRSDLFTYEEALEIGLYEALKLIK